MRVRITLLATFIFTSATAQVGDFWNTDFRKADSTALVFAGRDLKNPDRLATEITKGLTTDHEKFRAIFRWITDNVRYDYELYLKIARKENRHRYNPKKKSVLATRASRQVYRHMIRKKKTICGGYATLLEYMCEQVGLECPLVSGYARAFSLGGTRGPNHAWNAIRLGTKWYLSDVTWASGFVDTEVERFIKDFRDIYFLTDPSLLIASHFPSDERWKLLRNAPTLREFLDAPFTAEGFIENLINQYKPAKGEVRIKASDAFELRFTSNAPMVEPNARLTLTRTSDKKLFEQTSCPVTQNELGEYVVTHQFSKKGSYYVYISINNKLTFVYRVTVC